MADVLTDAQQRAVEHFEGPLMVLAGPGSGKTRVITHRIARLLEQGVLPDQILALTFTNKAAREMAERVERLLGGLRVQVSTFHRFCSRILRRWPEAVGLKQNFTILDHADQVNLVRQIMKEENLDAVHHEPGRVLSRISRARNDLIGSDDYCRAFEQRVGNPLEAIVYTVFPHYEQRVRDQNAVDFDDLLLHVVRILEDDDQLRSYLDAQYRFILVDEYQDTNLAQYRIVHAMSQEYPNLCATGDPDQSIYGWRGARPENISNFERDFPSLKIVALDQNFRSTQSIVRCADRLISNNHRRHRGCLTTHNPEGDPARLSLFENGDREADGIAREISQLVAAGTRRFGDFAVFYRVNALSRPLETALSRHQVPYQVAAGFSFYERTEVRDLIAYLRVIENHADTAALQRIINRPVRGIGAKTILQLTDYAAQKGISVFDAACQAETIRGLTSRSRKPIRAFTDLILRLNTLSANGPVAPVLERLIADIDYLSIWREESDDVDVDRQANVHELISAARQYDASCQIEDGQPPSLQGFLERACLSSEVDNVDERHGAVTLMTLHAAKGLEFPAVYIVGLENGLIPHERAVRNGDPTSFEEERRLLFVGITRAMHDLTLTQTTERNFRGMRRTTISSPFVSEIEAEITRASIDDDETSSSRRPLRESVTAAAVNERLQEARRRFEAAQQQPDRPKIMTGAEMEAGKLSGTLPAAVAGSAPASEPIFTQGMLVRHPRYGRGVVTSVSAVSRRGTVTVQFENDDYTETFVASRCPLQPIGMR